MSTLHMRSLLDKEMHQLQEAIIQMASMVDQAIDCAIQALITLNLDLARQVMIDDSEINRLRYQVEDKSIRLLATQQPAASDLRFVVGAIHIAVELERMGDHAAGIARLVERIKLEPAAPLVNRLPKMGRQARKMLKDSIDAYVHRATDMAQSTLDREIKIDRGYRKLFEEATLEMSNDALIRRATYLLWAGHNLERIGDRAINIAERVIYITTGKFVEYNPDLAFTEAQPPPTSPPSPPAPSD